MRVFETVKKGNLSVDIAKDRLKVLLISDRVNCTPDTLEKVRHDLYITISRYMEITEENFDVQMTNSYIYIKLTGDEA